MHKFSIHVFDHICYFFWRNVVPEKLVTPMIIHSCNEILACCFVWIYFCECKKIHQIIHSLTDLLHLLLSEEVFKCNKEVQASCFNKLQTVNPYKVISYIYIWEDLDAWVWINNEVKKKCMYSANVLSWTRTENQNLLFWKMKILMISFYLCWPFSANLLHSMC